MVLEGFLILCGFFILVSLVLYFACNPEDDENDAEVLLLD